MKHFENLWLEGEAVSSQVTFNQFEINTAIRNKLDKLTACDSTEQREVIFGQILLYLCMLSYHLDVNTFSALQQAVVDGKVILLEKFDSGIIISSKIVSEPGATLKVTEYELSPAAKAALTLKIGKF